jgi:putative salt-induced outer membrane protein YdiY
MARHCLESSTAGCALLLAICLAGGAIRSASAEAVILQLNGGDRLSGEIVSENSTQLVLSNRWNPGLLVPISQITNREAVAATRIVGDTNAAPHQPSLLSKAVQPLRPTPQKNWKGEVQGGIDLRSGAKDQEVYSGRFKVTYEQFYKSSPNEAFRNFLDYSVQYGKTDGIKSSDRMWAQDKMAFDLSRRWYVYDIAAVGYDKIQKIDFQYDVGPGLGYHLYALTNFTMNVESGISYQVQYRTEEKDGTGVTVHTLLQDPFYRLAEDVAWKLGERTSLSERLEFFPRVDFTEYRLRFETTLSYDLWRNVAFHLNFLELYDTAPATDVARNEATIRSLLGVKF